MRVFSKILILLFILMSVQTARAEWVKQKVNTLAWLQSIHFADENKGWIGGSRGTLLMTTDGGKTWNKTPKFTDDTIRDIFFLDKETGWLLCHRDIFSLGTKSPSYLMKTKDGGKTWNKIEFENKQRQRITKMFFAKSGFGLAIGETGALFGLEDDNQSWKKLAPPSSYLMLDGAFSDNLHGTIVGGGGTILFTEDAGTSWNQAYITEDSRSKLNSVFYVNEKDGWAVGSKGTIYKTVNAGRYWRSQKTGVDNNLNDVFFANVADGWAVGDDGTILRSTSGGNVWEKVGSKSPHKLERIFFNGQKGWIIGFGGTILVYQDEAEAKLNRPTLRTR